VTRALVIALMAFLAGSVAAVAAPGAWKVVAGGSATGPYAVADVSVTVDKPAAVGVRVIGPAQGVTWSFACSGTIKRAVPNRIYALGTARAADCQVNALSSGQGSPATVQILARER
jgi:hypothetical protein